MPAMGRTCVSDCGAGRLETLVDGETETGGHEAAKETGEVD